MNAFHVEIHQQAAALRQCAGHYGGGRLGDVLGAAPRPARVVLTGMGASFHAALWASYLLQARGIWAIAVEASELLHFSRLLLEGSDRLVVISQSGSSAELLPLLDHVPAGVPVLGITNSDTSPLARRSQAFMTLEAGDEATVASKTYLNTLACLWLLGQGWARGQDAADVDQILHLADRVEALTGDADAVADAWINRLGPLSRMCFVGHGPHVATARQGAMMMGEWLKRPALGTGIGAFRHGIIEMVNGDSGVVILGGGGHTGHSVSLLAGELTSYGATVLQVAEGRIVPRGIDPRRDFDEMLSPFLDVVPMQIFVEGMARRLRIEPGFRHITKVIANI